MATIASLVSGVISFWIVITFILLLYSLFKFITGGKSLFGHGKSISDWVTGTESIEKKEELLETELRGLETKELQEEREILATLERLRNAFKQFTGWGAPDWGKYTPQLQQLVYQVRTEANSYLAPNLQKTLKAVADLEAQESLLIETERKIAAAADDVKNNTEVKDAIEELKLSKREFEAVRDEMKEIKKLLEMRRELSKYIVDIKEAILHRNGSDGLNATDEAIKIVSKMMQLTQSAERLTMLSDALLHKQDKVTSAMEAAARSTP
ncbi:hypothetical protein KY330_02495 [Candidatus Woesearchaeota archaeon]|nr:hypothetical protein [Candidatus Woesearchaeota archaeon]